MAQVRASCKYYNRHDDEVYALVNMLAIDLIMNNLKAELKKKVEVSQEQVTPQERGGALAFYLVRKAVVRASHKHVDTIKKAIENYDISKLAGENIDEAVRVLRNSVSVLEAANAVPARIGEMLLKVFQTTSNERMTDIMHTWDITSVVNSVQVNQDDAFNKALEVYTDLLNEKLWLAKKPKKSSFMAKVTPNDKDKETPNSTKQEDETETPPGYKMVDRKLVKKKKRMKKKKKDSEDASNGEGTSGTTANASTVTPEE